MRLFHALDLRNSRLAPPAPACHGPPLHVSPSRSSNRPLPVRVLQASSKTFETDIAAFCRGATVPKDIHDAVAAIIADVRQRGDEAVGYYAAKFDGAKLRARDFRVKPTDIVAAAKRVPAADLKAL